MDSKITGECGVHLVGQKTWLGCDPQSGLGLPALLLSITFKPHATKDTFPSYLQLTVSNLPATNVITHFPGWLLGKKVNGMFGCFFFVTIKYLVIFFS